MKYLVDREFLKFADVPLQVAQEVAQVGVMPVRDRLPNGYTLEMAGQRFTVIGECTKEEFRRAVLTSGLEGAAERFMRVPPEYHFLRVVTD